MYVNDPSYVIPKGRYDKEQEKYKKVLEMLREARNDLEVVGNYGLSDCVDAGDCRNTVRLINKLLKEIGEEIGENPLIGEDEE